MAKPAWSIFNPGSGSGKVPVNVSSSTIHTGRTNRTGTFTGKATDVSDVPIPITQTAKPEFVDINNISAPQAGGNVTITGKSNSAKLNFSLGTGDIEITIPTSYIAAGVNTNNNVNIAGDPGATAEYDFSIQFNVPANTTIGAKSRIITVAAAGGQSASATITQAAGAPMLSITPSSVTLDYLGTPVQILVESNTNWTIE